MGCYKVPISQYQIGLSKNNAYVTYSRFSRKEFDKWARENSPDTNLAPAEIRNAPEGSVAALFDRGIDCPTWQSLEAR